MEHGGLEALFQLLEIADSKEVPTRRQAATALRTAANGTEIRCTQLEEASRPWFNIKMSGVDPDARDGGDAPFVLA